MTRDEIDEFLARPLVGVITTLDAEGRPRATPIWYAWKDGAAYMFTSRDSLKWRNLERNPYASLVRRLARAAVRGRHDGRPRAGGRGVGVRAGAGYGAPLLR